MAENFFVCGEFRSLVRDPKQWLFNHCTKTHFWENVADYFDIICRPEAHASFAWAQGRLCVEYYFSEFLVHAGNRRLKQGDKVPIKV